MKKLLILLKNTKNLLEYGDYGISGNTTFLGIYTSYDKLHERVLRDVKSINIREEEDESKDIFNRNICYISTAPGDHYNKAFQF